MDNVFHAHLNQDPRYNCLPNAPLVEDLPHLIFHAQDALLATSFNKPTQPVKPLVLYALLDALIAHQLVVAVNVELVIILVEQLQTKIVLLVLPIVPLALMEMYL